MSSARGVVLGQRFFQPLENERSALAEALPKIRLYGHL